MSSSNGSSNGNGNIKDHGKKRVFATRMLVFLALMIAFNIVFTRLLAINVLGSVRISLSFLPIVITSIIYGPFVGAFGAAAADFVGMMILPTGGPYFPGFTISQALYGLLYGLLFKKENYSFVNVLSGFALPNILIGIFLKAYWFTFITDSPFISWIMPNAMNVIILLPVQTAVFMAMKGYITKMRYGLVYNKA